MRLLDQAWIGRALFVSGAAKSKARDILTTNLANWWHPPRLVHAERPNLANWWHPPRLVHTDRPNLANWWHPPRLVHAERPNLANWWHPPRLVHAERPNLANWWHPPRLVHADRPNLANWWHPPRLVHADRPNLANWWHPPRLVHADRPNLANWWHPPRLVHAERPNLATYFAWRLFLWMPRKMWLMRLTCPDCGTKEELRSKGLYKRVRSVVDVTDVSYLAAGYMGCGSCKGTFIAWDLRILNQLPEGVRARFPVVLTYKYACDRAVIAALRARTLGNSPTALGTACRRPTARHTCAR